MVDIQQFNIKYFLTWIDLYQASGKINDEVVKHICGEIFKHYKDDLAALDIKDKFVKSILRQKDTLEQREKLLHFKYEKKRFNFYLKLKTRELRYTFRLDKRQQRKGLKVLFAELRKQGNKRIQTLSLPAPTGKETAPGALTSLCQKQITGALPQNSDNKSEV